MQFAADVPTLIPLPSIPDVRPGNLLPAPEPVPFPSQALASDVPHVDPEELCKSIASSPVVTETIGLDPEALTRRLTTPWTAENAFAECELPTPPLHMP